MGKQFSKVKDENLKTESTRTVDGDVQNSKEADKQAYQQQWDDKKAVGNTGIERVISPSGINVRIGNYRKSVSCYQPGSK